MRPFTLSRRSLLAAGAGLLASSACSEERDCAFEDVSVQGRDTNPDGLPYPTGSFGADAGELFPNYTFQGHLNSNTSTLSVVSLADFFDPEHKRAKILHVMAAAMWCPHSSGQTDEMVQLVPSLRAEGLEVVQAIIEGPSRGSAPDRCDLETWVQTKRTSFTVVFDVLAKRLGFIAKFTGLPWNALIDTASMRVVVRADGWPTDYEQFVREGLSAL